MAYAGVTILAKIAYDLAGDALSTNDFNKNYLYLILGIAAFVIIAGGYLLVRFLASFIRLIRGAADLGKHMTVEGPIIKLHERRVAVDDGTSDEAVAWYPPPNAPRLERGMDIRAVMSPRLHHVTSVTVLSMQGVAPASSALAPASPPSVAVAPAPTVDAAAVQEITGLELPAVEPSQAGGLREFNVPGASAATFSDGHNTVAIAVADASGPAGAMFSAIGRIPGLRAQQIDGVGDAAFWLGGYTLLVRDGSTISMVHAALPNVDATRRLQIARALTLRLRGGESSPAVAVSTPPPSAVN
jgi:hypothetical protein